MQGRALRRLVIVAPLAGGLAWQWAAAFEISSLQESLILAESQAPAMLPPIASSGRSSWNCRAEQMVVTRNFEDASLPIIPQTH